jgi:hypothetical protein
MPAKEDWISRRFEPRVCVTAAGTGLALRVTAPSGGTPRFRVSGAAAACCVYRRLQTSRTCRGRLADTCTRRGRPQLCPGVAIGGPTRDVRTYSPGRALSPKRPPARVTLLASTRPPLVSSTVIPAVGCGPDARCPGGWPTLTKAVPLRVAVRGGSECPRGAPADDPAPKPNVARATRNAAIRVI